MSDMLINAHDARLSILGYQPEVKRIYWSALPNKLPTYGQTLDLSGCEIKAIYADGSEAVVTDYCTFSPDTGYTVPNAKTLTVTATYTARSGKAYEADEVLPICSLDHIKIIIPRSVPENIKERCLQYHGDSAPTISEYAQAFGFSGVYVAAYWSQGGEIVRITRLNTDDALSSSCCFYGPNLYTPCIELRVTTTNSATFDRYYAPTDHESVTYSHAFSLSASYTLYGQTYTDTAYLSADICTCYEMTNPPTSYSGTETVRIDGRDPSQWKLIYSETGDQPLSLLYPYLGEDVAAGGPAGPILFIPPGQSYIQRVPDPRFSSRYCFALDVTLTNNASGIFFKDRDYIPQTHTTNPQVKVEFSCSGGAVSWTFTPR